MINIEKDFQIVPGESYSFINPYSLGVVASSLSESDISEIKFYADGIAVVIYLKLFKSKSVTRTSFDDTSVAPRVFSYALEKKRTIALVGGTEQNINEAKRLLEEKYPGLNIILARSGYFTGISEYDEFLEKALLSDILVVGMGAGKQERVLLDMREKGWKGTGFTCGGYMDQFVHAKGDDYYPFWVNKLNLRWLYRMLKEPRRLLKRYLIDYPYFLFMYGNKVE